MINQLMALQQDVTTQYQTYQTALMLYMEFQWWLNLQALRQEGLGLHQDKLLQGHALQEAQQQQRVQALHQVQGDRVLHQDYKVPRIIMHSYRPPRKWHESYKRPYGTH